MKKKYVDKYNERMYAPVINVLLQPHANVRQNKTNHKIANLLCAFSIKSNRSLSVKHTLLRKLLLNMNFMFDEFLLRRKRRKKHNSGLI